MLTNVAPPMMLMSTVKEDHPGTTYQWKIFDSTARTASSNPNNVTITPSNLLRTDSNSNITAARPAGSWLDRAPRAPPRLAEDLTICPRRLGGLRYRYIVIVSREVG